MWINFKYKDKETEYKFIREIKKRINYNTKDKVILLLEGRIREKVFLISLKYGMFFKNKSNYKLILLGISQKDILKQNKEFRKYFSIGID